MDDIIVEENDIRIDHYLKDKLDLSRTKVQRLIKEDKILVNGKTIKSNYCIKEKDHITIDEVSDRVIEVLPQNIKLDILYEDEYLLIINKKSGMVVHPAPGNYQDTLVNALLYYLNKEKTTDIRPGIVHRLDKDTSGVMVVARTEKVHELLSEMIKNREIKRTYVALVVGNINHETGVIDAPIGRDINNRQKQAVTDINSKNAITHFKVLQRYKDYTLIECKLETGRTHQIRVHLAYILHPVVNDPLYNKKKSTSFGQLLHSKSIEFIHPITKERIYYEAEVPKEFTDIVNKLVN